MLLDKLFSFAQVNKVSNGVIFQSRICGSRDDTTSYCSKEENEAFNLKTFADSNDVLVEWFYDRERFLTAIQCIAKSADRFFCDNN